MRLKSRWWVAGAMSLVGAAALVVACSEGAPPEVEVQQVNDSAGQSVTEVEQAPQTETERLAEQRANTPQELLDALGEVTLADGTKASAIAVLEERAALIDRFNELKGVLAKGGVSAEEANAMVAEVEELAARVRILTEGQYQRSPEELEQLKKEDERAVSGTTLTPEKLEQIKALQKEISPTDETRADEYAARKAELFR